MYDIYGNPVITNLPTKIAIKRNNLSFTRAKEESL